jgi:hypothetical protein
MLQGIIVGVLVVAAALYVFRALAPLRWRRKLGLARRGAGAAAGSDAATNGNGCGCSSCPPGSVGREAQRKAGGPH